MVLDDNIFSLLCYEQTEVIDFDEQRKRIIVQRSQSHRERSPARSWVASEQIAVRS